VAYPRVLMTSFIANAFGHNLGLAAFTGGAVRFRMYASAGLTAIDVATVQGFCSLTIGIGLATLGGLSLTLEPTIPRPCCICIRAGRCWSGSSCFRA